MYPVLNTLCTSRAIAQNAFASKLGGLVISCKWQGTRLIIIHKIKGQAQASGLDDV